MNKFLSASLQILRRFVLFVIPLLFLLGWGIRTVYNSQYQVMLSKMESLQRESISVTEFFLKKTFQSLLDDLNLVLHSNEFQDYLSLPDETTYGEVQGMFSRVIRSKPLFRQLRYLDSSGMEIVRVNRNGEEIRIVPPGELQDKSRRDYVDIMAAVPEQTLYISGFDLNIENNQVVLPYEPIVRFGIPVYRNSRYMGFLLINFDSLSLLSILEEFNRQPSDLLDLGILDSNRRISLNQEDADSSSIISSLLYPLDLEDDEDKAIQENTGDTISGRFVFGDRQYYFQKLVFDGPFSARFPSEARRWMIISSFSISKALQREQSPLLKNPGRQYLILLLFALLALGVLIIAYLREDEHLMLKAMGYISENTHDGVIITDRNRRIIYCNQVFENTFGYTFRQVRGVQPEILLEGIGKIDFSEEQEEDGFLWTGNLWDKTSNGTYILKNLQVKAVLSGGSKPVYYIGIYSEPKAPNFQTGGEEKGPLVLKYLDDQLIGLIDPFFSRQFRNSRKYAVVAIKIFDYSGVKNQLTEPEENGFVNTLSREFRGLLENGGLITAPSSSVLVLALPYFHEDLSINDLMLQIDGAISAVRFLNSGSIRIDYLSGIAISQDHGETAGELIHNAFIALEALIKVKKTKYLVYDSNIYESVLKDRLIREQIDRGFQNREYSVVYQVQKNTVTRKTTGVEALVRWDNAILGSVPPYQFVPIMEESDRIRRLGKYVLELIIRDFETVAHSLPEDFRISFNLSSQEFNDKTIVSELIARIRTSGLPTSRFCFEITESTLVEDIIHTNGIIEYLHENGILAAIDDFGTGYSSLSYLKNLRSDKLKIDRMFVKDYPEFDEGIILKAIVSMAREIGISVIVEGIETAEQLELILDLECEEYQGYYGSRPLPFAEFLKLL